MKRRSIRKKIISFGTVALLLWMTSCGVITIEKATEAQSITTEGTKESVPVQDTTQDFEETTEADTIETKETAVATEESVNTENTTEQPTEVETEKEEQPPVAFLEPPVLSVESGFYSKAMELQMQAAEGLKIYYTLDGSEPNENSTLYERSIVLRKTSGDSPDATIVKAKVIASNGVASQTVVRTYFIADRIEDRFSTIVISVVGDPKDLTDGPDGIFWGKNYEKRGDESERPIYITAWDRNQEVIFTQNAGVRIYGAASRANSIKSMKIYARKIYDPLNGKFKTDLFQTAKVNEEGVIEKYDRLVIRNGGNDFQFAYLRDELNQRLAMMAGYSDYEAVESAVVYLNGKYYGLFWLHENYCNDFFVAKYGKKADAKGEFVILEGREAKKKGDSDGSKQEYADEFNGAYKKFIQQDLTNDTVYHELEQFMDVKNYLDYFAFNIYINNNDWPQNNYKCYRYYAGDKEAYGDGVYDGRWRFLLHDLDYSMNMYDQREVMYDYDNLGQILNKNSDRYAPLFAELMKRADCKAYFRGKMIELMEGALSEKSIVTTLDSMLLDRSKEMDYYYKHLAYLRDHGDHSIWSWSGHLQNYTDQIRDFAKKRPEYILKFLNLHL